MSWAVFSHGMNYSAVSVTNTASVSGTDSGTGILVPFLSDSARFVTRPSSHSCSIRVLHFADGLFLRLSVNLSHTQALGIYFAERKKNILASTFP